MDIIKKLAQELAIKEEQAKAAVQLIDEGNTIPFIARYRKEMTGALNDETLRNLHERLLYLRNLEEKKEQVINAITVHHYTHNNGITPKIGANVLLCEHYITPILNIL